MKRKFSLAVWAIGSLAVAGVAFADGGDTCASPPTFISSLPFADTGTTTGKANDFSALPAGCPVTSVPGEDVIYAYTIAGSNSITVTVTPAAGFDAIVYVLFGCGDATTCFSMNANGPGVAESFTIGQPNGTHALYIDSVDGSDGTYSLSVTGNLPVALQHFEVD